MARASALLVVIGCATHVAPHAPPAAHAPRPMPRRVTGPVTIATEQHDADNIVIDATHVYWSTDDGIWRAPLGGGAREPVAPRLGEILAMAGDATELYATVDGTGYHGVAKGHGKLVAIGKRDRAVRTLAEDLTWPKSVALDATDVYVADALDSISYDAPTGRVLRYARAGGAPVVLADHETSPTDLALDRDAVYWTNYGGSNAVRRATKRDGAVTELARDIGTPSGLALTADAVLIASYWTGVSRVAKTGGAVTKLSDTSALAIATDAETAYVRTRGGLLLAFPLAGGPARVISPAPASFFEPLAVDADAVYWTSRDASTVRRAPHRGATIHIASLPHTPAQVAVEGGSVFYLDTDSGRHADVIETPQPDLLYRASRDGDVPPALVHSTPRAMNAITSALAVDADAIYLSDPGAATVLAISRRDGKSQVIARGLRCVIELASDAAAVYIADCDRGVQRVTRADHRARTVIAGPVRGMVVAEDAVYAIAPAAIMRARSTGAAEVFVQQPQVTALVAGGDALYWSIGRTLFRTSRAHPASPDRFAILPPIDDAEVTSLAFDRDVVYVASHGGETDPGEVLRVDATGAVTTVLDGTGETSNLAISAGDLVVASGRLGAVLRIATVAPAAADSPAAPSPPAHTQ